MTPPRLALWLLERRFSGEAAECIVGDLTEKFSTRAARHGAWSARIWFWRQALSSSAVRAKGAHIVETSSNWHGRLADYGRDLRLGARGLRRTPGFAIAAILTLSLGIGSATAIGTAAARTLLRPLPFPASDRLVIAGQPDESGELGNLGYETGLDWRQRVTAFEQFAMMGGWQPTLVDTSGAERLNGQRVTSAYFQTLGIHLALGRDFNPNDDTPDHRRVVILSDSLWRRRFGASSTIVGTTVDFTGRKYEVVGVLPASFEPSISNDFHTHVDIWSPLGYAIGGDSSCRTCQHLKSVARLRPGVSIVQARQELTAVHVGLRREHPSDYAEAPPQIESAHDVLVATMKRPLQVLAAAVAFLLLVACANVAGLLMSRASDRAREMTLRSALGASRSRLVRQLILESLILALASAVGGALIARGGLALLVERAPAGVRGLDNTTADPWMLAIAGAASLAALLMFGVFPAFAAARVNLESSLRESRQASSKASIRAREWLMALQVAAALLVVGSGGLMFHTVDRLLRVDPGFNPHGVLTAGVSLIGARWAEDASVLAFQHDLIDRVRTLPGVTEAAVAGQIPMGGNYDRAGFRPEGRTFASDADAPSVERYGVSPGYFATMNIPLKRGRLFSDADAANAQLVMIIGETTARMIYPGQDSIGTRVRLGSDAHPTMLTIVGIVGDVRHYDLGTPPAPQFYIPQAQRTDSYLTLIVRAAHPEQLTDAVRRQVTSLGSDVPVFDIALFDSLVDASMAARKFLMLLLGVLGGMTLTLAGVGLYGVASSSVAARRRELGIRIALGAAPGNVLTLIARRSLALVAAGAAVGLIAAGAAGYLIRSQLYETAPFDPAALAASMALLILVVIAAHIGPARRALQADPRETLTDGR